jgi:hypothetical protein
VVLVSADNYNFAEVPAGTDFQLCYRFEEGGYITTQPPSTSTGLLFKLLHTSVSHLYLTAAASCNEAQLASDYSTAEAASRR